MVHCAGKQTRERGKGAGDDASRHSIKNAGKRAVSGPWRLDGLDDCGLVHVRARNAVEADGCVRRAESAMQARQGRECAYEGKYCFGNVAPGGPNLQPTRGVARCSVRLFGHGARLAQRAEFEASTRPRSAPQSISLISAALWMESAPPMQKPITPTLAGSTPHAGACRRTLAIARSASDSGTSGRPASR